MDDPSARLGGLTVYLMKRESGGDEVVYWAALAKLERQEGDEFQFECTLQAPAEAGDYLLRAVYKRDEVAESKISVLPPPAGDGK